MQNASSLAPRSASLAQGFALVAICTACFAGAQALAAAWPHGPAFIEPICGAPIELVPKDDAPRLGCATELPPGACSLAHAGDRVVFRPAGHTGDNAACYVQNDGMRAGWMLAWGLPLDINRRSAAELVLVPGIGAGLAERIVAYRVQHGPFSHLRDLTAVRGVGTKSLRKLTRYITAGQAVAPVDPGDAGGTWTPGSPITL